MKQYLQVFTIFALVLYCVVAKAASADSPLFSSAPSPRSAIAMAPYVERSRYVLIDLEQLADPTRSSIELNLFDDVILTLQRQSSGTDTVWMGVINGIDDSYALLSIAHGVVMGSVVENGREHYQIVPVDGSIHAVYEIDPTQIIAPPALATDAIIPTLSDQSISLSLPQLNESSADNLGNFCIDGEEDGSVIDILVAYTAASAEFLGGASAIEAWINLRVAEMNLANRQSDVNFRWNLIKAIQTDYTETGDNLIDLARLTTTNDGYLDDVYVAREIYHADIAVLVNSIGSTNGCGAASQLPKLDKKYASTAFASLHLEYEGDQYSCSKETLAHEIGHTIGNDHELQSASPQQLTPYSFGYQSPDQSFRTMMAYDCPNGYCSIIHYWSNPNIFYQGQATGTGQANNARSMNEAAKLVSNFRPNCLRPTLLINEVDGEMPNDSAEFIELKAISAQPVQLDQYAIDLINSDGSIGRTIPLPTHTLDTGERFVICSDSADLPNCTMPILSGNDWLPNGSPKGVVLRDIELNKVIDSVSYGGDVPYFTEDKGTVADDFAAPFVSLSRVIDGGDTNRNANDWALRCATPGEANSDLSAECTASLTIDQTTDAKTIVYVGDPINYTTLITNDGAIPALVNLNSVWSTGLATPQCQAEVSTMVYSSQPVALGIFQVDPARCTNALGQPVTIFNDTGDAQNSSPIECAIDVPVDAILTTYSANISWDAVSCSPMRCRSHDVNQIDIIAPSGMINQHPFILSNGTLDLFSYNLIQNDNGLANQPTKGEWRIRVYDNSWFNQGIELMTGAGLTELTLYGYPAQADFAPTEGSDTGNGEYSIPANGSLRVACSAEIAPTACIDPLATIATQSSINSSQDSNTPLTTAITLPFDAQSCPQIAKLSVELTTPIKEIADGDNVVYTIKTTNHGELAATTTITNPHLPNFRVQQCKAFQINPDGSRLNLSAADVNAGAVHTIAPSASVIYDCLAKAEVAQCGGASLSVSNQAFVSAPQDPRTQIASQEQIYTVSPAVCAAAIEMTTETDSAEAIPNQPLTYTIHLTNSGNLTTTINLAHTLSADVEDVECLLSNGQIGDLTHGATHVLPPDFALTYRCTMQVQPSACSADEISYQTTVSQNGTILQQSPMLITPIGRTGCLPSLTLSQTTSPTIAVKRGDSLTYRIEVGNIGWGEGVATLNIQPTSWQANFECTAPFKAGENFITLGVGEKRIIECDAQVNTPLNWCSGQLGLRSTLSAPNDPQGVLAQTSTKEVACVELESELALTSNDGVILPTSNVVWQVTMRNTGKVATSEIDLSADFNALHFTPTICERFPENRTDWLVSADALFQSSGKLLPNEIITLVCRGKVEVKSADVVYGSPTAETGCFVANSPTVSPLISQLESVVTLNSAEWSNTLTETATIQCPSFLEFQANFPAPTAVTFTQGDGTSDPTGFENPLGLYSLVVVGAFLLLLLATARVTQRVLKTHWVFTPLLW